MKRVMSRHAYITRVVDAREYVAATAQRFMTMEPVKVYRIQTKPRPGDGKRAALARLGAR